jgi:hypothetical protein
MSIKLSTGGWCSKFSSLSSCYVYITLSWCVRWHTRFMFYLFTLIVFQNNVYLLTKYRICACVCVREGEKNLIFLSLFTDESHIRDQVNETGNELIFVWSWFSRLCWVIIENWERILPLSLYFYLFLHFVL